MNNIYVKWILQHITHICIKEWYNVLSGKDDTSVQFAQAINAAEVSSRLEEEHFVAIRLESGSEAYRFFAQICILLCNVLLATLFSFVSGILKVFLRLNDQINWYQCHPCFSSGKMVHRWK